MCVCVSVCVCVCVGEWASEGDQEAGGGQSRHTAGPAHQQRQTRHLSGCAEEVKE